MKTAMGTTFDAGFLARFHAGYTPVTESGCWLWMKCVTAAGYGQIGLGRKVVYTHRVAWEAHNGPIPDGMYVCHKCDTPSCCNPNHLFVGSSSENARDMTRKGRNFKTDYKGEEHHLSKLTEPDVLEIRRLRRAGELTKDIASRFGVDRHTVTAVTSRKTWKHVA